MEPMLYCCMYRQQSAAKFPYLFDQKIGVSEIRIRIRGKNHNTEPLIPSLGSS